MKLFYAILGVRLIVPLLFVASVLGASSTGGSGVSTLACAGGPLAPCARQDLGIIPTTAVLPAPAKGVPFVDPDTGEVLVRLTDASTVGTGQPAPQEFIVPDAAAVGPYSSALGGYPVDVVNWGSSYYLMTVAWPSLVPTLNLSSSNSAWEGLIPLDAASMAGTDPRFAFGTSKNCVGCSGNVTTLYKYQFPGTGTGADTLQQIVDLSVSGNCGTGSGALPTIAGSYLGLMHNSRDDTKLSYYAGGIEQDHTRYFIVYNSSAPSCYWLDTLTMTMGGTGLAATSLNWTMPAPAAAPALSAGSGSLAAATYDLTDGFVTFNNNMYGNPADIPEPETTPSPVGTFAASVNTGITVARPTVGSDLPSQFYTLGRSLYAWTAYACEPNPCTPALQAAFTAPVTPTLTFVTGTSIPLADVVSVQITESGTNGEGFLSTLTTAGPSVSGTQNLSIPAPTQQSGATKWTAYAAQCTSPGPCSNLTFQASSTSFSTAMTPGSILSGTALPQVGEIPWAVTSFTVGTLATGGNAAPTVNYAGQTLHGATIMPGGTYARIANAVDALLPQANIFWQPGTTNIYMCTLNFSSSFTSHCGGHPSAGNATFVNADDTGAYPYTDLSILTRPLGALAAITSLVQTPPSPANMPQDSHFAWGNSAPGDNNPIYGIWYSANNFGASDGTQSGSNPALVTTTRALTNEGVMLATNTHDQWWRLFHPRSSGTLNNMPGMAISELNNSFNELPNPNIGPDGKLLLFTSNWMWSLGTASGLWGSGENTAVWEVQQTATNSNIWELALNTGITGSPAPTWNTGYGQTTVDNSGPNQVTWETIPGCPANTNYPTWKSGQAVALNYTIQDPETLFEHVTTVGGTASMPATPPAWPDWKITAISRTSNVVTATVTPTPPGTLVGKSINLQNVVSLDLSFIGTFNVASVSGNQMTWNQSGTNESGTPENAWVAYPAGSPVTDSNGNVWTMYVPTLSNPGPLIGSKYPFGWCRTDVFAVAIK